VDLVKGKGGWRITSATGRGAFLRAPSARRIFFAFGRLLTRLLAGEERHPELYDDVLLGLMYAEGLSDNSSHLRAAEMLLVIRALFLLGYWGEKEEYRELLPPAPWSHETIARVVHERRQLLLLLNATLRDTHL
jgi:hypothetical protein